VGEKDLTQQTCPECGAIWRTGVTCEDHFHQMLYWENEDPERGVVHHLMVLGYHLQHPSLYSPDGLAYSLGLLVDFVEHGISTEQARKQNRSRVDSSQRNWKIRGKPGSQGSYSHPVRWHMTAQDVVNAGAERYVESVQQWARSILDDLRASGNL
jgi:hypothetical protein